MAGFQVSPEGMGHAPVKLMNADPSLKHLEGAAYDPSGKNLFVDPKNRLRIQVAEKTGQSYRIAISWR